MKKFIIYNNYLFKILLLNEEAVKFFGTYSLINLLIN